MSTSADQPLSRQKVSNTISGTSGRRSSTLMATFD